MSVNETTSIIQLVGAAGFGTLIGWYVYYVNRHRTEGVKMTDIVTLIGVLGGSAVLTLFPASTDLFGAYGIGLAIGFFAYFGVLNLFVSESSRSTGNFNKEWFLDGRCKKPSEDQTTQPVPMKGGSRNSDKPEPH